MDADPELIRQEIQRTRAEMGETAAAISRRLDVTTHVGRAIGERRAVLRSAVDEARRPSPGASGAAAAVDRAGRALEALRGHSLLLALLIWAIGAAVILVASPSR